MDEALLDRFAAGVDLPLDPEHRPGVAEALERLLALAAVVAAAAVPDEVEPAPVFEP
ncbi:MAG: DUF4089 domain-containing protein [Candidatus Rokubacteria bacterium]|nr:DUF4089 domain-containing protein [Candidatus Rokubacteria bacterium]